MDRMVAEIATETDRGNVTNHVSFQHRGATKTLWWRFEGQGIRQGPRTAGFALLALIAYAMHAGADLHVKGVVSRSLLESLDECVDAWVLWRPDLFKRISLTADSEIEENLPAGRDAVATFSGGVDATFAFIANKTGLLGRRSLDIGAAVMVHGFDVPVGRPDWFELASGHARNIVADFETPLITVRTNWRDISVNWEMEFGFAVVAVLHQFDGGYSNGVWAADEPYDREVIPWGNNSITNPLLGGRSFPIRAIGAGFGRTRKVEIISQWASVREHVRVCWERPETGHNCGECEKCVRTRLNFLAAGFPEVPAFPGRLTPELIRRISLRNQAQRALLQDILDNYGKSLPLEIRRATSAVLRRPLSGRSIGARLVNRLGRVFDKARGASG